MNRYTYMDSPIGPLRLMAHGDSLTELFLPPLPARDPAGERDDEAPLLAEAKRQLEAYFNGRLTAFDLPLAPHGTTFQQRVWTELARIPYGVTISYGELARRIGHPDAARAVGLANGRNPIAIVVPCHRVIGADGRLTGYGGGLPCKQALLQFEASVRANGARPFPAPGAVALDL